ncbi:hypothetical protein J6590_032393 [Homalodisca vitripennis]|nr:hypothetical protein J6590_032393 [Homalodisca vitripennis]
MHCYVVICEYTSKHGDYGCCSKSATVCDSIGGGEQPACPEFTLVPVSEARLMYWAGSVYTIVSLTLSSSQTY